MNAQHRHLVKQWLHRDLNKAEAKIDELQARVATLEAALREIADITHDYETTQTEDIRAIARAALSPSPSAPADEYRRGFADGVQASSQAMPPHLLVKCIHSRSYGLWLGCKECWSATAESAEDRIRALAPPSPSSAATKEEP